MKSSLLVLIFVPVVMCAADNSNLVYKGCAQAGLSDPYSSALSAIFGTLIQQSSRSKFFKTASGSVSGLFQCRGDLTNVECYDCVSRLPILMEKLCGKTVAARIQLLGCYMLYEVSGFAQISGMELLYKTCGRTGGNGFQETRDSAFSSLESVAGTGNGDGGFYTTSYNSVYVLGQCQGDLGASDCRNCVKTALQRAQVECGSSVSGQIYLHRCFISYNYYTKNNNNNNNNNHDDGPNYPSSTSSSSSSATGSSNTGRTVAIILGGAAGVGFIIVVFLIARKAMKKDDVYPKVKVRQEDSVESMRIFSLKDFHFLSLYDHPSAGASSLFLPFDSPFSINDWLVGWLVAEQHKDDYTPPHVRSVHISGSAKEAII
ncbi:hypothetical protein R6Q57_017210 [Mikania cordata]